ncbi:MAG: ATP-binding cassette domain-containing protein [Synergistaceae bacterium]|jgi:ABC-type glutathione transport system ATPase component|nr:ATP-binding cassette domain-containing protein [Synergistaceae bacterium]
MSEERELLLRSIGLRMEYRLKGGRTFVAVDDVSFSLRRGETLGIVGESGSGKTTIGKIVSGIIVPSGGRVVFNGIDITHGNRRLEHKRAIQYIYQDPYSALNPKMRVLDILREPLRLYFYLSRKDEDRRAIALLSDVGLGEEILSRYPRELSGGQCQRVGIARALAGNPELIICDEPTSALDMTIQSQIVELLKSLQRTKGCSYLFISHSLAVVSDMSRDILVMREGRVEERILAEDLFSHPLNEYTKALVAATPRVYAPYYDI